MYETGASFCCLSCARDQIDVVDLYVREFANCVMSCSSRFGSSAWLATLFVTLADTFKHVATRDSVYPWMRV
jgi:hypothetical protein